MDAEHLKRILIVDDESDVTELLDYKFKQASLDPYTFTRDAYLQKRLNDIYDGNPPMMDDFDDPEQPAPMVAPNQPATQGNVEPKPKNP